LKLKFLITFLTQHLGENKPALFRVYKIERNVPFISIYSNLRVLNLCVCVRERYQTVMSTVMWQHPAFSQSLLLFLPTCLCLHN